MSPFSELSECLVSTIVKYIYLNTPSSEVVDHLYPLLYVSSTWRKAAQSVLARTCTVDDIDSSLSFYIWPQVYFSDIENIPGRDKLFEQVKEVVKIGFIQPILRNPTTDSELIFPYAESLHLEIYSPEYIDSYSQIVFELTEEYCNTKPDHLLENALKFVECVKGMVPQANDISIKLGNNFCNYVPNSGDITDCMLGLFDQANRRSLTVHQMSINIGLVDSAIRLSALEIDWFENDGIVERIIRNNAGTLESLSIYMNKKTVSRIWKIVGCDDQIVYPQLQTVNIQAEDVSECYSLESNIDPKHVPFPKLRHLTVDSNYSYTAETFLRGSVKTVEYLDVQLTANILGILTELYSNCDQPAVRQVLLRIPNYTQYLSNGVYNDASYCTMMTKFLDALPRDLLGLRLRESTLNNICILDSVMKKFTKLHILQADGAKMRISQVCKLASLVPSLRHLYISDIKVDELFHKTEIRDIVTRLSKEYQVADSNLRYVELLGEVDSSYNINDMLTEVANCSSILMVLCPRFNQIKFEEYWQKAVYEPTSDLESELSE